MSRASQPTAANRTESTEPAFSAFFCSDESCKRVLVPEESHWMCPAGHGVTSEIDTKMTTTHQHRCSDHSVGSETFFAGPTTDIPCPECGQEQVYYHLRQTRSADESETRFFTCQSCEHKWRDED